MRQERSEQVRMEKNQMLYREPAVLGIFAGIKADRRKNHCVWERVRVGGWDWNYDHITDRKRKPGWKKRLV